MSRFKIRFLAEHWTNNYFFVQTENLDKEAVKEKIEELLPSWKEDWTLKDIDKHKYDDMDFNSVHAGEMNVIGYTHLGFVDEWKDGEWHRVKHPISQRQSQKQRSEQD